MTLPEQSQALLDYYRREVRPLLERHLPERAAGFDREATRIEQLVSQLGAETPVCFLGQSGVGKSTLINAVVAGASTILPQGGIGPLTAQATTVRYATHASFRVEYLPPKYLNQLVFALTEHHKANEQREGRSAESIADPGEELDEEETEEIKVDAQQQRSERINGYLRQARLLVTGNAYSDVSIPYLVHCLRLVLNQATPSELSPTVEDQKRLEGLKRAVELARSKQCYERRGEGDSAALIQELRDHASGFLAPLIKTLEVGWPSPSLVGNLVLVDLPGVGIANDEYRRVTQDYIRTRAKAIALVVDRALITEGAADLLRSSGFFGRLLHSADDPLADPVRLLLIIVKLDLSADDDWRDERQRDPSRARKWKDHFAPIREKAIERARQQLRDLLEGELSKAGGEDSETRPVVERSMADLQLHAVSAPEYKKLLAQDDEDRPRIGDASESGIPPLALALRDVAQDHADALQAKAVSAIKGFRDRLVASLNLMHETWSDDDRTPAEIERIREQMSEESPPLRRELYARQGEFRGFLAEALPERIDGVLERAKSKAQSEIEAHLATLEDAHWMTLRAAVRRGGTFVGARHIDLPTTFATKVDEPVALGWSRSILSALRARTSRLAEDYVDIIDQLATAIERSGIQVRGKLLKTLRENLAEDAKGLSAVGKDKVEDLRELVRAKLLDAVVDPIRRRCKRFVDEEEDRGRGVKRRMLELFGELAKLAVEAAEKPAKKILLDSFRAVEGEIREVFDKYPDPLEMAIDAIVESQASRIQKDDEKQQREVLGAVQKALTHLAGNA